MEGKSSLDQYRMPNAMWEQMKELLPEYPVHERGGRPRADLRRVADAIFYRFRTGCQWKAIPRELAAGSTAHQYFQEWARCGVFERMWEVLQLRFIRSGVPFEGELCLRALGVRQQVTLTFRDREIVISKKRPGKEARVLSLSQADLFKLITGYGSWEDLPLGPLDKKTEALLRSLFPRGKCTFWPNDRV